VKQTVAFFGVVIFLIVAWLVGFIDKLQGDVDVSHGFNEERAVMGEGEYSKNYRVNSSGNEVLILNKHSLVKQKELWNKSGLKEDMLELFPDFSEIKYFINEHIEDDGSFKNELLGHVKKVEVKYISGTLTGRKAKVMLSNF